METNSQIMPELMQKIHNLQFEYLDGEGIDFEPYEAFLSKQDTQGWFRAWTGNKNAEEPPYLIFGQDGTGGYVALWRIREGANLLDQPVVFFGSEGELGVIAQNFSDYLWLLAGGHGPYEAVNGPDDNQKADTEFLEFAKRHATTPQRQPSQIIASAVTEFPSFEEDIRSQCE